MNRTRTPFRALRVEALERREVPAALQIVFDYRFDTNGFFNDPARRGVLEQAGRDISTRLNNTVDLAPIAPQGANTWSATFFHPSNPAVQASVPNLAVGTDQIVVFVGSDGTVGGSEAGLGGYGGYSATGTQSWFDTLRSRGRSGFATWGGSIAFDGGTNWSFNSTPAANQLDFYTVATHELGHVLGFGVSNQWNALVSGGQFTGANARAANGGTNPRVSTSNPGHWQQGITSNGAAVSMQPFVSAGTRVRFSNLDFASLADLGWEVSSAASPPPPAVAVPPVSPPVSPPTTAAQLGRTDPLVVGGSDGTFQMYTLSGTTVSALGTPVTPFPGFTGAIRVATGDFDGDGVKDVAVAAGPGGGPAVMIFDGRTGQMERMFFAYEQRFTGGVLLAAGDITGDGRDDLVTGADRGGGPRARVFSAADPNAVVADFWGIDDENFRGGVRVVVYDGRSFTGGVPNRLVWDFYAYHLGVNEGAFVGVGDTNGDGFADLILGPGSGSAHLQVLSGATLTQHGGPAAVNAPLVSAIYPQPAGYGSGARVAAGDYDGDGTTDILTASGANALGRLYFRTARGEFGILPFDGRYQLDGLSVG